MNLSINKDNMKEYIKINLPLTEQDYLSGNGEGVWVLVDSETKEKYDQDAEGNGFIGILDNDSSYYPGLNAGELIPFEMRGEYRPVADFHGFLEKRTKLTPEGKTLLIQRIAEHHASTEMIAITVSICYNCQYCGDKNSFPEPNDMLETDPENPMLKHFYCCCGDCELYEQDVTFLGIQKCDHFDEL